MANHSSTKKAIRKIESRSKINQNRKTRIKTFINKVNVAVQNDVNSDELIQIFTTAQSEIAKGVSHGILHKNTAARKISLLSKKVKTLSESKKK